MSEQIIPPDRSGPNRSSLSGSWFNGSTFGVAALAVIIGFSLWQFGASAPWHEAPTPAPHAEATRARDGQQTGGQRGSDPAGEIPRRGVIRKHVGVARRLVRAGHRTRFDIVRVSPDGRSVLAGRSAPNADIRVTQSGGGSESAELGRTRSDDQGQWVMTPDQPILPGGRALSLAASSNKGAEILADTPVMVLVPERPPTPARRVAPQTVAMGSLANRTGATGSGPTGTSARGSARISPSRRCRVIARWHPVRP